jgi:flagellar hook-basal body complex protein FliE
MGDTTGRGSGDGDFLSVLSEFAGQTVAKVREGEAAAAAGITGQRPIQEVVDKVVAAEQALQTGMAIREKAVSAWLEISRISI